MFEKIFINPNHINVKQHKRMWSKKIIYGLLLLIIALTATFFIFRYILKSKQYFNDIESPLSVSKPVTDGFGVNIDFTHPKGGELEMIRDAGFKWVRMDFYWDKTEIQKGVYDFSDYEFLLSQLDKQNMSAYYILGYNNRMYDNVITESGRKGYVKWAATAVEHFKERGIIWEIWDQPNDILFRHKKPNVTQYITMALETMKAIRENSPKEIVVGPATLGVDLKFLEECFKSGLLNYWDAVSVHPYRPSNPETVYKEYNQLKSLIEKYKPEGKQIPIVSGEWGYSDVWKGFTENKQGIYLQRELLINVMHKIPISIWYEWRNGGENTNEPENHFGIVKYEYRNGLKPVYKPKNAYLAAKTMNTVLNGFYFVKRISTKNANDYVLLFSDGKDLRVFVWTTESTHHYISFPSNNSDFDVIHYKGGLKQTVTASNGLLTFMVNESPHLIFLKGPDHAFETIPEAKYTEINE